MPAVITRIFSEMSTELNSSLLWNILTQEAPHEGEGKDDEEEDDGQEEVSEISYWRDTLPEDVRSLVRMFRTPQTTSMFGRVDLDLQLELAHTALTQINAEGVIVGYIALLEYPNVPAVPSFAWLEWIQNLYGESDNDDLAPIFNKISKRFVQKYGKYYIAEIIAHPTEGRECIVGERNQFAVGMMCLNRDINLDVLNENFELAAFNGLHKWDEDDFIPFPQSSTEDSREHMRLVAISDVDEP
ncbi:Uncharacterized protein C20orf26 [Gryllus bimaculatus]|nr:Uncharacterized protein C20orf26 [Gryllus bimaculatus]